MAKSVSEHIDDFREAHGERYSYGNFFRRPRTSGKGSRTFVTVICSEHGPFEQLIDNHKKGVGCLQCSGREKINKDSFIPLLMERGIELIEYGGSMGKLSKFRCISCAYEWASRAQGVVNRGSGCARCSGNLPVSINELSERLAKTGLTLVSYAGGTNKNGSIIRCTTCEKEWVGQVATYVSSRNTGCGNCAQQARWSNKPSKISQAWLDDLNIIIREKWISRKGRIFCVDGYCDATNTIYEFYGDYWHANPAKYSADDPIMNKTAKEVWERDHERETLLCSWGYKLIKIWESDYLKFSKT